MTDLKLSYRIAVMIVNCISKTWRITVTGEPIPDRGIFVFWHGYMLPGWLVFKSKNPVGVVSQSKDGALLSALLERWGYSLIRGSSSKAGKQVLNEICDSAKNNIIAMTPDGPRGPAQKMKAGAVIASLRSNTPIYLVGIKMNCSYTFRKSWDSFKFPLPFSKIQVSISQPVINNPDMSEDEINNRISGLENKLNEMY